ncbi:MAG: hypothetical protein ABEJ05_13540, partial [Haloglomus sp.]
STHPGGSKHRNRATTGSDVRSATTPGVLASEASERSSERALTDGREREGFVAVPEVAIAVREREGFVAVPEVAIAVREREGFVAVPGVAVTVRERRASEKSPSSAES